MIQYELKNTSPASVSTRIDGTTTTRVVQSFTVGVVGCPSSYNMIAWDSIEVDVLNATTKTQDQIDAEIIASVNAYIANKYPPTE